MTVMQEDHTSVWYYGMILITNVRVNGVMVFVYYPFMI